MQERNPKSDVDKTTKIFFYLCVGFCVSFFLWASFSPLDIVSNAIGEVIPSSRVKRIQHLEGGIVHEIKVREGEMVESGQPLIELEATASDSTVEEINVRVNSLRTEIARLEAESRWFEPPTGNGTEGADSTKPIRLYVDPNTIDPEFPEELETQFVDLVTHVRALYSAKRDRFSQ